MHMYQGLEAGASIAPPRRTEGSALFMGGWAARATDRRCIPNKQGQFRGGRGKGSRPTKGPADRDSGIDVDGASAYTHSPVPTRHGSTLAWRALGVAEARRPPTNAGLSISNANPSASFTRARRALFGRSRDVSVWGLRPFKPSNQVPKSVLLRGPARGVSHKRPLATY